MKAHIWYYEYNMHITTQNKEFVIGTWDIIVIINHQGVPPWIWYMYYKVSTVLANNFFITPWLNCCRMNTNMSGGYTRLFLQHTFFDCCKLFTDEYNEITIFLERWKHICTINHRSVSQQWIFSSYDAHFTWADRLLTHLIVCVDWEILLMPLCSCRTLLFIVWPIVQQLFLKVSTSMHHHLGSLFYWKMKSTLMNSLQTSTFLYIVNKCMHKILSTGTCTKGWLGKKSLQMHTIFQPCISLHLVRALTVHAL